MLLRFRPRPPGSEGVRAQGHPLVRAWRRFASVRDSGERESAESGTAGAVARPWASARRDTLSETFCFAFRLLPLACSRYSFTDSRAPLGPSLRQRRDSTLTRGCSSPSPSSLLLNSRCISFIFHLSSALCPSLRQLWGKHPSARQGCAVAAQCPISRWGN